MQGWEDLAGETEKHAPALPIAGVNLHIERLTGYGQVVKSLQVDAVRRGDGLAAQLASDSLNGEVVWLPHGYENGEKYSAHLSNLYWVADEKSGQARLPADPSEPAPLHQAERTDRTASRQAAGH